MMICKKFYYYVFFCFFKFVFHSNLFVDPNIEYPYKETSKNIKLIFEKVLSKYITEFGNNKLYSINLFGLNLSSNKFKISDYISRQLCMETQIFFTEFICLKEGFLVENRNTLMFEILKSYRNEQKNINLKTYSQVNKRNLEFEFIQNTNTSQIFNSNISLSDLQNEILRTLNKNEKYSSEDTKNDIYRIYIVTPFVLKLIDIKVLEYIIKEVLDTLIPDKDTFILFFRQKNDYQVYISENLFFNNFYQLLREADHSGNLFVNIKKNILVSKTTCFDDSEHISEQKNPKEDLIDELKSKNLPNIINSETKNATSLIQSDLQSYLADKIPRFLDQTLLFIAAISSEEKKTYDGFSFFQTNYVFRIFDVEIFRIELYFQIEQIGNIRYFTLHSNLPRSTQFNQICQIQYEITTHNIKFLYYDSRNQRRDTISIFFYALNHRVEDEIESFVHLSYE